MEFKDYYQTLGIEKTASPEEIKKAFRRMARKYHPDVSKEPDAEAQMKEVNAAYETLSDPEKRAAYDQLGQRYQHGQPFEGAPDWDMGFEYSGAGNQGADQADFNAFFSELFRQSRQGKTSGTQGLRGEDHHAKIEIDLRDAYLGNTVTVTLNRPTLNPQGIVTMTPHPLNVKIPQGIKAGQRIRLTGQGGPAYGPAPAGDLYLEIHFRTDGLYQVDGRDVNLHVPVTPWEAALGASITIPTPIEKLQLKVPPNARQGQKLRLRGKGIPGQPPGDFYVTLEIALPSADSEKAKEIYRNMAENLAFNPREKLGV